MGHYSLKTLAVTTTSLERCKKHFKSFQSGIKKFQQKQKTILKPLLYLSWKRNPMWMSLDFGTKNSCEEVGNEFGVWLINSFGWLVRLIETYSNRGKRPVQHGRPGLGGRVWTFVRSSFLNQEKILSSFSSTRYQSSQPVD